ncbi:MAG: hypothetical protein ABJQ21_25650 [Roseibium sp.]
MVYFAKRIKTLFPVLALLMIPAFFATTGADAKGFEQHLDDITKKHGELMQAHDEATESFDQFANILSTEEQKLEAIKLQLAGANEAVRRIANARNDTENRALAAAKRKQLRLQGMYQNILATVDATRNRLQETTRQAIDRNRNIRTVFGGGSTAANDQRADSRQQEPERHGIVQDLVEASGAAIHSHQKNLVQQLAETEAKIGENRDRLQNRFIRKKKRSDREADQERLQGQKNDLIRQLGQRIRHYERVLRGLDSLRTAHHPPRRGLVLQRPTDLPPAVQSNLARGGLQFSGTSSTQTPQSQQSRFSAVPGGDRQYDQVTSMLPPPNVDGRIGGAANSRSQYTRAPVRQPGQNLYDQPDQDL